MKDLIEKMISRAFKNPMLDELHDGSVFTPSTPRLAFTTDSYVIQPLFFPGGDIGKLAVCGTVNDLAMCGARPRYLSLGLILEEGLPMETLWKVICSIQETAASTGVWVVTGDTKVVERGKGDGIFINTAGVGEIDHDLKIGPGQVKPGDQILLSGDLGRHGMAVMAQREGLTFGSEIESDLAPLAELVLNLFAEGVTIHCLRDLTRGGLASALNEISQSAKMQCAIEERAIPVREDVRAACEILGLDPLYVANEGRLVAFVPPNSAEKALEIMKKHPLGKGSEIIGTVSEGTSGLVVLRNSMGTQRVLPMLSGEQLPRIC